MPGKINLGALIQHNINMTQYLGVLLSAFLFFVFENLIAQHEPRQFGDVPLNDLISKKCEFDTAASAAILFDVVREALGKTYKYERHVRIKFYNNVSIDQWANIRLHYVRQIQSLSNIKGVTYNLEDGKIVSYPLDKENILQRKVTKEIQETSFALPQVKAGSVIEYSYKLNIYRDMSFTNIIAAIAGVNPVETTWQFQNDIPVFRSDFFYEGGFTSSYLQGLHKQFVRQELGKLPHTIHWYVETVPAFHVEKNAQDKDDLIGKLFIDLSDKTWGQVGSMFNRLERYGLTGRDSNLVKQFAEKFRPITNPAAKVDSIVKFVKNKIKWNGEVDLSPDSEFADVFTSGNGSTGEINLIMNAILRKAGIRSHAVLISNRGHGRISTIRPRVTQFNDVVASVVTVDEKIRLLDGTDRYLPNDFLPLRCLNGNGLLLDGRNSLVIPITTGKSKKGVVANIRLSDSYELENTQLDLTFHGLTASYERKQLDSLGDQAYKLKLKVTYPSIEGDILFFDTKNGDKPFKISSHLNHSDLVTFSNDHIYINPFEIARIKSDLFVSDSRVFPIDLGSPSDQTFVFKIELPENIVIEELPKPIAHSLLNNGARFSYSITERDNILFITSQMVFNRTVFEAGEYQSLKEFYKSIFSKQSENIVLRKSK